MSELLDRAISEWARGDFYEAHETLEDFADSVEDQDADFTTAMALIHVAASLHKLVNDVGKNAVPAKLAKALEALRAAPPAWQGLNLEKLRRELGELSTKLEKDGVEKSFEASAMPRPERA